MEDIKHAFYQFKNRDGFTHKKSKKSMMMEYDMDQKSPLCANITNDSSSALYGFERNGCDRNKPN